MKFKFVVLLVCLFTFLEKVKSQSNPISVMDFIKIKDGKKAEAIFFYENNWKIYREAALKKNVIHSFQMLVGWPDTLNNFDLVLITTYKDSAQYLEGEENFQGIIKELRPSGPKLLNEFKPVDFRQNVFLKRLHVLSGKCEIHRVE